MKQRLEQIRCELVSSEPLFEVIVGVPGDRSFDVVMEVAQLLKEWWCVPCGRRTVRLQTDYVMNDENVEEVVFPT